jgi:uncharacterized membrane protein HdeD (DUF308 family)
MRSLWWFWALNGLITGLLGLYFLMRPNFEMGDLLKFFGFYLAVSAVSLIYIAAKRAGGSIVKTAWFTLSLIFLVLAYLLVFKTQSLVAISNLFLGIVMLAGTAYFGYAAYRDPKLRTFNGLITTVLAITSVIFLIFPPREGSTLTKTLLGGVLMLFGLYIILISAKSAFKKGES